MSPKDRVLDAITHVFDQGDASAIDRYWSPSYVEHSRLGDGTLEGLRRLAASLPPDFRHERTRVLGDGDLVMAHGLYYGIAPEPIVACDQWRVDGEQIVEHWDAQQSWAAPTPSGHTMIDGPSEVTEPEKAHANKTFVQDFVSLIMMGGDRSQLPRFFEGDEFVQHNPIIADGVSGLGSAIQSGVWAAVVERCHRMVAEGEFVFTQGEGTLHGLPTAFYDLFRLEAGRLAEHWDVVEPITDSVTHRNGLF